MIRPIGITEVGISVCQGFGLDRRPDRIYQIRAGFNYDDEITAADDGESKLIVLNPKTLIICLGIRIPQYSRKLTEN